MIRPRTLAISPLLTIGTVTAILIAAALSFRPATEPVVPPQKATVIEAPIPMAPAIPQRFLTVEAFPDHYEGHFLWDGQQYEDHQWVALDVEEKSQVGELIVATGQGTYSDDRGDVDFTFRIEANPTTGEWTMWESEPEVAAFFVTEGRHEATFIDSLENVSARWIGDNGIHGKLVLHATSESMRADLDEKSDWFEAVPADAMHLPGGVRLDRRFTGERQDCVLDDSDRATVHYSGWNAEGVFDDSWKRGRPAAFRPNQVIPGFAAALLELCTGDYARVWIPANMAYGDSASARIAGDLIFDIEIISVQR